MIYKLGHLIGKFGVMTNIEVIRHFKPYSYPVRAVPEPFSGGLLDRIGDAWAILSGHAYAVKWPEPGELEIALGYREYTSTSEDDPTPKQPEKIDDIATFNSDLNVMLINKDTIPPPPEDRLGVLNKCVEPTKNTIIVDKNFDLTPSGSIKRYTASNNPPSGRTSGSKE